MSEGREDLVPFDRVDILDVPSWIRETMREVAEEYSLDVNKLAFDDSSIAGWGLEVYYAGKPYGGILLMGYDRLSRRHYERTPEEIEKNIREVFERIASDVRPPRRAVTDAQLRAMLEKARRDLEIPEDFKIVTENLKEKAASISFNSRVIRINEELLYDPEIVNYLIYHELAHYKLRTKFHPPRFYDLLYSKLGEENVREIERRVLRKMREINGRGSLERRAPRRR